MLHPGLEADGQAGGQPFLDEVGELPLDTQVKLLRVLQEREFEPVGSNRSVRVDVRIICATNRNLEQDVKAGKFREDLFYRLSVVTLRVPSLKERRTDIPLLAERFLSVVLDREGHKQLTLSEETIRTLVAYNWPGNVRELESAIEYAVLHARGHAIDPEDLPEKLQSAQVRSAPAVRAPAASVNASARLELLEYFLAHHEDLMRCAQASLDWLARWAGIRRAVCLAVDAESNQLVGLAGHGAVGAEAARLQRQLLCATEAYGVPSAFTSRPTSRKRPGS